MLPGIIVDNLALEYRHSLSAGGQYSAMENTINAKCQIVNSECQIVDNSQADGRSLTSEIVAPIIYRIDCIASC